MNLLGNAVKFTEKGSITISVKPVDDSIEPAVTDTGQGIPAADLLSSTSSGRWRGGQKEGSGLGLSIARKSVEQLGGTISVVSEQGEGTTFTLQLKDYATPVVEPPAPV